MKRLLLILAFIAFFISVSAQNNWVEGYILKTPSDTIKGFVDDMGSKSNSKKCFFRDNLDSEVLTFFPDQIYAYRIQNGKYYVSREIDKGVSSEALFLEFLIQGEVNLYHVKDGAEKYYIEKDTLFLELENTTEVRKNKEGLDYERRNNEYKGTMSVLMSEVNMQESIYNCDFNSKSLIKVAKKYHESICDDQECIVFETKERKLDFSFGIIAGATYNSFTFQKELMTDYVFGQVIGGRFVFDNAIEWFERLNFHIDLLLQHYSSYNLYVENNDIVPVTYEGEYYHIISADLPPIVNSTDNLAVDFSALALRIPLTMNYLFNRGDTKPYIGLGLTNQFFLTQNEDFIYHRFHERYGKSLPTYNFGFLAKAGLSHKLNKGELYLDLTYEITHSPEINYRLRNQLFALTMTYAF